VDKRVHSRDVFCFVFVKLYFIGFVFSFCFVSVFDQVTWQADCCDKKVQTVAVHPTQPHYFAAASLDRTVRIFDLRKLPASASAQSCAATSSSSSSSNSSAFAASNPASSDASANPPSFKAVATFQDGNSVNCAYWSPDGGCLLSVTQGNHLRLFANAEAAFSGDQGAAAAAACTVPHDNQTGRYLPVFHACWDPKRPRSFVLGSMSRNPRIVEVFGVSGAAGAADPSASPAAAAAAGPSLGKGKAAAASPSLACRRVAVLKGDGLASVQSRLAVHPFHDLVAGANASGRVHIFD
jgi:hypothetical protein